MGQEKQQQSLVDLSKQLSDILEELLSVGDWSSSLFLRVVSHKLQAIRKQIDEVITGGDAVSGEENEKKDLSSEQSKVFVLLYQNEGENLEGWFNTIKTLTEYSVTRPAYKEEAHVQEVIRSKDSDVGRNGYVIVDVKNEDLSLEEEQQLDQFDHPLVALKEGTIKLENVVEFVHANKKRYVVKDNKLELLGEVKV